MHRRDGNQWSPASFADAPPVLVSEALRGVDLLVSVAGFGLEHDDRLRRDDRRWGLLSRLAGQWLPYDEHPARTDHPHRGRPGRRRRPLAGEVRDRAAAHQ